MDPFYMLLFQRLTWPAFKAARGLSPPIFWLLVYFCLRFCYLLCGWEGSAADSRIFDEARRSDFAIEPGTYYLADAGFPLCDALLVPYRGCLVPFEGMGASQLTVGFILCISWLLLTFPLVSGLQITKRLFNLCHSSLQNAIERIFGVCKRHFRLMSARG